MSAVKPSLPVHPLLMGDLEHHVRPPHLLYERTTYYMLRILPFPSCRATPLLLLLRGRGLSRTLQALYVISDGAEFDYIVVGAGGAGAATAARLTLAGRRVLLVEAGPEPHLLSTIPGAAPLLLGSSLDWQYDTLPNNVSCLAYRGRQCRFSHGRCLGGSTSINYMMYSRAAPSDFDDLHIPGWSWDDVYPYFLRSEGLQHLPRLPPSSVPYHNTTGPMRIGFFSDSRNPWHSRLIEAYRSLNVPFNPDVCAKSQIGVTQVVGYVYNNERMSTARGYLARPDVERHLNVATMTRCTGVILENDQAKGITVVHGQTQMRLFATKEVILSAGAIGTPQILMLSGIGPAEHLRKFNITARVDLPVGDRLVDHPVALAFVKVDRRSGITRDLLDASETAYRLAELLVRRQGPLTSDGLTDVTAFFNSDCYDFEKRQLTARNGSEECARPTLQCIHAYVDRKRIKLSGSAFRRGTDLVESAVEQLRGANANHALLVWSAVLLRPRSTGTVRLASSDPLAPPAIFPNLLADRRDLEETVRALLILEDLLETKSFTRRNASLVALELEGCPRYERGSRAYWECYSRHMSRGAYHAAGSARLGGVVDGRLRVLGTRGLRAGDLSVLPRPVSANTAAAAIAIGERLAQFLLEEERGDE
ncbi:hypothetical protein evm_002520 [Chilo suppressalis]|nr:hypothetical protein evm_014282 [Chilo suppressalis]RVE52863.1 hypothetical protein evm_002520 [Chilo suppressalis]